MLKYKSKCLWYIIPSVLCNTISALPTEPNNSQSLNYFSHGIPATVDVVRLADRRTPEKRPVRTGKLPAVLCRNPRQLLAGRNAGYRKGHCYRRVPKPIVSLQGPADRVRENAPVADVPVGLAPAVVLGTTVHLLPGRRVRRHPGGRGRGAHTDRRVPRPGHRMADVDCVPSGRRPVVPSQRPGHRCCRTSQAAKLLPTELHQQRRVKQLEDGRGRLVRGICPADRHRGRAPGLQRGR